MAGLAASVTTTKHIGLSALATTKNTTPLQYRANAILCQGLANK